jgi:hypothetical protein
VPSACAPAVTPHVVELHFDATGRAHVELLGEQAKVFRQMTVVAAALPYRAQPCGLVSYYYRDAT